MAALLPILAFVFGALIVTGTVYLVVSSRSVAIDRRIREVTGTSHTIDQSSTSPDHVTAFFKRIGERVPKPTRELGTVQVRLVQAGYRSGEAVAVFFGIRFACAVTGFALLGTPLFMRPNFGLALGALGFGYLLPGMALGRLARRRQHRIQLSLADALDLLVVSVEAGLGLDQAMMRVSQELRAAHPDLAEELRIANLELVAGTARSDALRHLADRTGVEDLSALVTMLVQTDKFGTSVANSLRVYSDTLRTKRRQRAEEAAAKTGVKMVFPLVLCIFPAIWIVTIGPAAIKFVKVLFPMAQ